MACRSGAPRFSLLLFFAAESFHYMHDRKKHLCLLLLGNWVVTLGSALLQNLLSNRQVILMSNAFSTFFVAGLQMFFRDRFWKAFVKRVPRRSSPTFYCALFRFC